MMRFHASSVWLSALTALVLAACDGGGGGGSTEPEPRRCDVLYEVQARLGTRIASPAPVGGRLVDYAISNGESIVAPGTGACVQQIAAQLDSACGGCAQRPETCEQLVRTIFANPIDACTACGDGVCLAGESPANCAEDCQASCGDGVCASTESDLFCPEDCATACGDSVCAAGETPQSCARDCNYSVGNGRCEPGESPTNSPADCQGATCGDGYCQSYETTLLCAGDCCRPGICNQDARVCIDGNTLGRCAVRGLGNCPELVDPQPCEFGCRTTVPGVSCDPADPRCGEARCVTCEELARATGYLGENEPAVFGCTPGDTCGTLDLGGGQTVAAAIECLELPGFAGCTVGRIVQSCMPGEACSAGTCLSCEQQARASGAYDFENEDYVFGCALGPFSCISGITSPDDGTLHDYLADCQEVVGAPGCTIGALRTDCGPSPQNGALCSEGGLCHCTAAAEASGAFDFANKDYAFGCELGPATCYPALPSPEDGTLHDYVVDCQEVPGVPACRFGEPILDCGPIDPAGPLCLSADSECLCRGAAIASGAYDLVNDAYVFGCDVGALSCYSAHQASPTSLRDLLVDCETIPDAPACTIGRVVLDCGETVSVQVPLCESSNACACEAIARESGAYDFVANDYLFDCPLGDAVCVAAVPRDSTTGETEVFAVQCQTMPEDPQCTIGRVLQACGAFSAGASCTNGACD